MKQIQFAAVTFASFLFACGGDPRSSQAQALNLVELDAPVPVGTFEGATGEISRLVLMTDDTVHLETSSAVIDGFYTQVEDRDARSLYLLDEREAVLDSYEYRYDGTALEIRRDQDPRWQSLSPGLAWCDVAAQCAAQLLPHPACLGQWTCINNGCQYRCRRP